jgi:hypothetical protein
MEDAFEEMSQCSVCHCTIGLDPDHEWPDGKPTCWSCLYEQRDILLKLVKRFVKLDTPNDGATWEWPAMVKLHHDCTAILVTEFL